MKRNNKVLLRTIRSELRNSFARISKTANEVEDLLKKIEKSEGAYIPVNESELSILTRLKNIDIRGICFESIEGMQFIAFIAPSRKKKEPNSGSEKK